jgi:hypothetical protein
MCISHKNDTAYPERDAKGVRVDKSSKKKVPYGYTSLNKF